MTAPDALTDGRLNRGDAPASAAPRAMSHDDAGDRAPPGDGHGRRARRLARYATSRGVYHLTMLTLCALFAFPFVWMLGMSLKTDEEATGAAMWPAVPTFVGRSPYVRAAPEAARPALADDDRWAALRPRLVEIARAALDRLPTPAAARAQDADALRAAAAELAVAVGLNRLEDGLFAPGAADDAEVARRFADAIVDADLAGLLLDRLGRLELGDVQVRSLRGQVTAVPAQWQVVSGDAELVPAASPADAPTLRYRFADAGATPVVLRCAFDARMPADALHRLLVSYKGDASWHRFDVDFALGGRRYASQQPSFVAQHRGASLLLQPPTFQDATLGPRNWVPLRPTESVASDAPTSATLTLTLRPSSTARAVLGKVERNYARAFRSVPFWTYVGNSVAIVVLQLAGALFSSAFVGYAFARLNWPGRSLAMGLLLATMMLPAQVTMVPTFLIWRELGWYNTLNPLWFGAWLGNAFFIFLMVQHMRTIPKELDEAARIDGMSALQTWWYVIVPQVRPTLAAIAILTFMGAWNEFMGPLVMLRDQAKFPLSLGLFSMRLDAGDDWPLIMAGNLLMTLPVVVIFFLFQRYFIEGVTVSGMKG